MIYNIRYDYKVVKLQTYKRKEGVSRGGCLEKVLEGMVVKSNGWTDNTMDMH